MLTTDVFCLFQDNVREFMVCMEQARNVFPSREVLDLRWTLIEEEMNELREEFIKYQEETKDGGLVSKDTAKQIMKELTDLEYVTAGYGVTFGIPVVPHSEYFVVFNMSDRNFTKTEEVGKRFVDIENAVQSLYAAHMRMFSICTFLKKSSASPFTLFFEVASQLAHLTHTIIDFAEACGIDLVEVFMSVQESNMSKLGNDGKPIYRGDGKVMKGPNYHKPDMDKFIYDRTDVA